LADGRAGYQDYIHNLDKLTVYVDVDSHRGNYYTRGHAAAAAAGRSSAAKRAADGDGGGGVLCGVRSRAAVATAAGARGADAAAAAGGGGSGTVPLASPFPARIHVPCRQPAVGRYVMVEASGVPSRYSRLFGAVLCDVVVYQ